MESHKLRARVMTIVTQLDKIPPITNDPDCWLNKALAHRSLKKWAWIIHDKDVYTQSDFDEYDTNPEVSAFADKLDEDEGEGKKLGDKKAPHIHIILRAPGGVEVERVAKWFHVPMNLVKIPKGKNAFTDCLGYLTHEDEKQREMGKYVYPDEAMHANFDWREELRQAAEKKAKYGSSDVSRKQMLMYDIRYEGKPLREVWTEEPILYAENRAVFQQLRSDYLLTQKPPTYRQNFYVCGGGGMGKGLCSRALARALFPDLEAEECYFEVGQDDVTFVGYDGQPVIIWNDCRAQDLLKKLGGRGNVFNVFDPFPSRGRQHVKYGSVNLLNCVNIVNSVQDYTEFLEELVRMDEKPKRKSKKKGEEEKDEGEVELEDVSQSSRRFPFIIPLYYDYFEFLLNKGYFEGTDEYETYQRYARVTGSFAQLAHRFGDTPVRYQLEGRLVALPVGKAQESRELMKARAEENASDYNEDDYANYGGFEETDVSEIRLDLRSR